MCIVGGEGKKTKTKITLGTSSKHIIASSAYRYPFRKLHASHPSIHAKKNGKNPLFYVGSPSLVVRQEKVH